jgi:tRNA threonylcarbamoyl adenosine modification protein YjeE
MPALTRTVDDEAGTRRVAEDLAMILARGDVIALEGDLGMGKTAFARALLRALADDDALEVPSPTFTLAQVYETPALTVTHFDLYRLADPGELTEIGFDDAIAGGAALVEWPDRAGRALPASTLTIAIDETATADGRRFTFSGDDRWRSRLDRSFAIRALLDRPGGPPARRRRMAGDASSRRYERARRGGDRLVVMDWPRRPPQAPLADGLSYPELVHVQDDPLAFTGVAAILRDGGFRVPDIESVDRAAGLIVMEDLGEDGLVVAGVPDPARFLAAAKILAEKDAARLPTAVDVPGLGRWTVPAFDRRAMLTELSLLPDWYLPLVTGSAVDPAARADFLALWAPLVDRLNGLPGGLLLRDVIAANLVWMGGEGRRRVAFLDVQDAMVGPEAYDLMSLTTDVRLDLAPDLVAAMRAAYVAARRAADPGFDRDTFDLGFALASAQRNSKILGGFARLAVRDGKAGYLDHLPLALKRVGDALSHPVLAPLRLWYERHRLTD